MAELGALGKLDWVQVEGVGGTVGHRNAWAFYFCACRTDSNSYSNICSTGIHSRDN
jgi:hypothetical protein